MSTLAHAPDVKRVHNPAGLFAKSYGDRTDKTGQGMRGPRVGLHSPAMDRIFTRVVLSFLAILALSQVGARCQVAAASRSLPATSTEQRVWASAPVPRVEIAVAPRASLEVPDSCRRLVWHTERREVSKERAPWLNDGRERWRRQQALRVLVGIVAETLGADELAAEVIWRKAIYESSGDPSNVHVKTKDVAANRSAADKGRRRSSERWRRVQVPVYTATSRGLVESDGFDAWALGRGLYGQVTGLHLHRWGSDVPPWSLCDPVIATVTVIWSMRAGLDECHGSTLRDAYRRFSSGKCATRAPDKEARFDTLARGHVRGLKLGRLDPDARAVLGDSWDEETADREVLLAVLRERVGIAESAGG